MIEAYPYFLQKDSEPFRFEIIENQTHQTIKLSASAQDDLDFSSQLESLTLLKSEGRKCLLEIDFGFNAGFDFSSQIRFSSCILAIEEILKTVIRPYKGIIEGLILFRGTAFLEHIYTLQDQSLFDHIDPNLDQVFDHKTNLRLAAATVLGTIFHRLVSFMDDDVPCFAIFHDAERLSPIERAIVFSKQRFEHIFLVYSNPEFQSTNVDLSKGLSALGYLSLENLQEPPFIETGILLPEDAKLSQEILRKLEQLILSIQHPYRIIPEKIFNECWNDIQTVYYAPNSIHHMTARMIKGFEASGGEAIEI
jgi:hypothetical protein